MRKRTWIGSVLVAAVAIAALVGRGSDDSTSPTADPHVRDNARAHVDARRDRTRLQRGGSRVMPAHDERVSTFLAERELDEALKAKLVDLAQAQRVAFAPRDAADAPESPGDREARRALRDDFRAQLRGVLAAMPDDTRAAMQRHRVNPVLLARAVEATR